DTRDDVLKERHRAARICRCLTRRTQKRSQEVLGVEPHIDTAELSEATDQKPSPNEEHECERDLGDRQDGSNSRAAGAASVPRTRFFQHLVRLTLERLESRNHAERYSRSQSSDEREDQHSRVDAGFLQQWHGWTELNEKA